MNCACDPVARRGIRGWHARAVIGLLCIFTVLKLLAIRKSQNLILPATQPDTIYDAILSDVNTLRNVN